MTTPNKKFQDLVRKVQLDRKKKIVISYIMKNVNRDQSATPMRRHIINIADMFFYVYGNREIAFSVGVFQSVFNLKYNNLIDDGLDLSWYQCKMGMVVRCLAITLKNTRCKCAKKIEEKLRKNPTPNNLLCRIHEKWFKKVNVILANKLLPSLATVVVEYLITPFYHQTSQEIINKCLQRYNLPLIV